MPSQVRTRLLEALEALETLDYSDPETVIRSEVRADCAAQFRELFNELGLLSSNE